MYYFYITVTINRSLVVLSGPPLPPPILSLLLQNKESEGSFLDIGKKKEFFTFLHFVFSRQNKHLLQTDLFYFFIFKVSVMAVSELPGNPNAVWTVKRKSDGEFNFDFLFKI